MPTFSLKPLLLFTLGGVTGISVYSSLILGNSEGKTRVIESIQGAIAPFISTAKSVGEGLTKLYPPLSEWAKVVSNQQDAFIEWITNIDIGPAKISDGTRLIFNNLKEWIPKIINIVIKVLKVLFENPSKFREKIYHFSPFLWKAFSALNSPYVTDNAWALKFFDIVGHDKFEKFANIIAENGELISQLNGEEVEEMISAFEGDPETAVKFMEQLTKESNQDKASIMDKMKPFILIGKIKKANKEAESLISEAKIGGLTEDKNKRAEQVHKELKELETKLEDAIKKVAKDLLSRGQLKIPKVKR